ncbi:MAG: lycopene cyclase domain-containing protein [Leucobacter sp.]
MPGLYLLALLFSIGCMVLLDWRFQLFFWHDAIAATVVTITGFTLFLVWDLAGIAHDIFLRGESSIATGIVLAPELPLEEPVFLIFLVLCIMVVFTGAHKILMRTRKPEDLL